MELSRREALGLVLGLPLAAACSRIPAPRPIPGKRVGASHVRGHRLREKAPIALPAASMASIPVVVVGAGVAGLTAAWQLTRAGLIPGRDFVVLELEPVPGGTARGGSNAVGDHPWGAHYLPTPQQHHAPLTALLREVGALDGIDEHGEPVAAEACACRDPQERLFYGGQWTEGLYLHAGANAEDLRQRLAFEAVVQTWVAWRDGQGRKAFTLPVSACSDDAELHALDRLDAATWMAQQGFTSPRLVWTVTYACRDDYGTSLKATSAWAMLFYFTARVPRPGAESRPLLTWPEGNGRLVRHLSDAVAGALHCNTLVTDILPTNAGAQVTALSPCGTTLQGWQCDAVIFAGPQFVAKHVLRPYRDSPPAHLAAFSQSAWVVANLALSGRPKERGFPLAWDNVLYDSPSLGYVTATHQLDRDSGPTAFTYYHALSEDDGTEARQKLLSLTQPQWADTVISDLRRAHADLPELVTQLDVMVWGHAMVRPTPNLRASGALAAAAAPYRSIHFAHSELSGMALFEEAFSHGLRAADAVLVQRNRRAPAW